MGRRQFSREFKQEAVCLVRERGVAVGQASRDLEVGENLRGVGSRSLRPIQCRRFLGRDK